jgi:SHS2 domain-containing protein
MYEIIDHTADLGIRVFGDNAADLFKNAALALSNLLADTRLLRGSRSIVIQVSGDDWPDLMVNWLREILYLWNGQEELVQRVEIESIREKRMVSRVFFDPYSPQKHILNREIKAVTYHQIQVIDTGSRWEATIIFDV